MLPAPRAGAAASGTKLPGSDDFRGKIAVSMETLMLDRQTGVHLLLLVVWKHPATPGPSSVAGGAGFRRTLWGAGHKHITPKWPLAGVMGQTGHQVVTGGVSIFKISSSAPWRGVEN